MRVARTISGVREVLAGPRRAGRRIGLVPTMGAFHDGHVALMRAARENCDVVVVSLFVNPAQFDEQADYSAYPRVEEEDFAIAERAQADLLFAPSAREMYPAGFATTVSVAGLSETLEGAHRPGHFDGVCTVVCKLLTIVAPDAAWFGTKDFQQLLVVRRMVADLDLPVRIAALETVREPDGLALSSRNRRLSDAQRERAVALPRSLRAAARAIRAGAGDAGEIRARALAEAGDAIAFEYLELVDPATLKPLPRLPAGDVLVVAAARVDDIRLIDNQLVPAGPARDAVGDTAPPPSEEAA